MYGTHTLAFQRIFVRIKIISLIFIRFSYVSLIRNGVTGPLRKKIIENVKKYNTYNNDAIIICNKNIII